MHNLSLIAVIIIPSDEINMEAKEDCRGMDHGTCYALYERTAKEKLQELPDNNSIKYCMPNICKSDE